MASRGGLCESFRRRDRVCASSPRAARWQGRSGSARTSSSATRRSMRCSTTASEAAARHPRRAEGARGDADCRAAGTGGDRAGERAAVRRRLVRRDRRQGSDRQAHGPGRPTRARECAAAYGSSAWTRTISTPEPGYGARAISVRIAVGVSDAAGRCGRVSEHTSSISAGSSSPGSYARNTGSLTVATTRRAGSAQRDPLGVLPSAFRDLGAFVRTRIVFTASARALPGDSE
jgi:hypothetical protein